MIRMRREFGILVNYGFWELGIRRVGWGCFVEGLVGRGRCLCFFV